MRQHLIITYLLSMLGCVQPNSFTVTASEGGTAEIDCSHAWAHGNIKYLCRNPCDSEKDTLITSDTNFHPAAKYSLVDHGSGRFTVTVSNVQLSDDGIYYCAVERFIKDTFTKVTLIVKPRTTPPYSSTTVSPSVHSSSTVQSATTDDDMEDSKETSDEDNVEHGAEDADDDTNVDARMNPENKSNGKSGVLVYVGAGLGVLVFVLMLSLVLLYRKKGKKSHATGNTSNSCDSGHNQQCDYTDVVHVSRPSAQPPIASDPSPLYSNVTPLLPNHKTRRVVGRVKSQQEPTEYATVKFQSQPAEGVVAHESTEDSLQYAAVRFPEPIAGGGGGGGGLGREAAIIYSTVNMQ
ncbi:CMRF35-like molecule 1 isoform X1 [Engraulis encrasicolus]|uniref:CMRF35-like molecule 1 isoform X1 n=1 Tax=Engraulis encrasicolus TaxID=184585 RepID=UPI002FD48592